MSCLIDDTEFYEMETGRLGNADGMRSGMWNGNGSIDF